MYRIPNIIKPMGELFMSPPLKLDSEKYVRFCFDIKMTNLIF